MYRSTAVQRGINSYPSPRPFRDLHRGSLPHEQLTNLPEVARVILVEQDPVVVLTTSVTAATRVATVLADTAVAGGHVATLLAVVG